MCFIHVIVIVVYRIVNAVKKLHVSHLCIKFQEKLQAQMAKEAEEDRAR